MKEPDSNTYRFASWLFIKLLGLCFVFAFVSIALEAYGLIGQQGICPLDQSVEMWIREWGPRAVLHHPTVFLLDRSDFALWYVITAGFFLSVMVFAGVATQLCLCLILVLYLSIVNVGGPFYQFQWDWLLVECALLSLFLKPWQALDPPLSKKMVAPSNLVVLLFLFLFFRVMFASGVVKLLSGDVGWRSFTTMNYYYQTQLLPTPLAWYADKLPGWLQFVSCSIAFFIELILPLIMFVPRVRVKVISFWLFFALQFCIQMTGNHGFFNFLSVVLSLFLLPDCCFKRVPGLLQKYCGWPRLSALSESGSMPGAGAFWPAGRSRWITVPLLCLFVLGSVRLAHRLELGYLVPQPLKEVAAAVRPFGLAGSYGLYNRVFDRRTEISIEGSDDLQTWQPYQFKYKIGELDKAPPVVSPLAPRLDWRMRFAVLVSQNHCHWFHSMVGHLLAGARPVTALLKECPSTPPRFIRAHVFEYRFTSAAEKELTGNWWKSEYLGPYLYPVELD